MSSTKILVNKRGSEQYLTIQALRFVAALAVVVLHASFYTAERLDPVLGIYQSGANGVRLFFVISGFVMIVSSKRLIGAEGAWRSFAAKRLVRIVPLYWAITLFKVAVLLTAPAMALHSALDWGFIAKSFLFFPAMNVDGEIRPVVGVGWTLNFEVFFYALFTIALALRIRPILFLAPTLIGVALLSLLRTEATPVPIRFWCDPIVLDFLAGMLIAQWAERSRTLPAAVGAAFAVFGLVYLFLPDLPRPDYFSLIGSLLTTAAAAAVIVAALSLENRIGPQLPHWLLYGGAASYSLYLVHPTAAPAVPALLAKLGLTMPVFSVLGGIAVALVAGAITYRFLETPLTRIASRWSNVRPRGGEATKPTPSGARR